MRRFPTSRTPRTDPEVTPPTEPSNSDRITWGQAADRLQSIETDRQRHRDKTSSLIASLNSNFETVIATAQYEGFFISATFMRADHSPCLC
jgi:hypothetical protein